LSFCVSELNSDNAILLFRVTGIYPDMPLVFDWKQVVLSDFVSSQKLKLLRIEAYADQTQQHSQPHRRARNGRRQGFVLLLQQNHSGLNYRRSSFAEIDKRTALVCENQPMYTQVQWKVLKGVCTSCHMIGSSQEVKIRALSERDWSESRVRFCSCSTCNSYLLLVAWPVSMFINISLSSQCWW